MVSLKIDHTPKMIKEALASAETSPILSQSQRMIIRDLIRACDHHRPIGPDGRHGDFHTDTCGCPDKPATTVPVQQYMDQANQNAAARSWANRWPTVLPTPDQDFFISTEYVAQDYHIHHDGSPWWDFPYAVCQGPPHELKPTNQGSCHFVTHVATLWGARREIRKQRRRAGTHVPLRQRPILDEDGRVIVG